MRLGWSGPQGGVGHRESSTTGSHGRQGGEGDMEEEVGNREEWAKGRSEPLGGVAQGRSWPPGVVGHRESWATGRSLPHGGVDHMETKTKISESNSSSPRHLTTLLCRSWRVPSGVS